MTLDIPVLFISDCAVCDCRHSEDGPPLSVDQQLCGPHEPQALLLPRGVPVAGGTLRALLWHCLLQHLVELLQGELQEIVDTCCISRFQLI